MDKKYVLLPFGNKVDTISTFYHLNTVICLTVVHNTYNHYLACSTPPFVTKYSNHSLVIQ